MRIDELKDRLGDRVDITERSFMLVPDGAPFTFEQFVAYTNSWARPAEMEPAAKFTYPWKGDAGPPSGSLPAQVAWRAASLFGNDAAQMMFHGLMDAYFRDNRDISDWNVLVDIASEAGIDRDLYVARLDNDKKNLASWVIEEHNNAIGQGINAVPAVVIGGVIPLSGAQDITTYVDAIDQYEQVRDGAAG